MKKPEPSLELTQSGMLRQLMDHISDNIYFMDRDGRITLISQWGAKWLGFDSPEEVIGKTDFDLFSEEHALAASADEQRIIRTGAPVIGIEEKETWPDGRVTWVSTTKMPLRDDDGEIIGIFGISRDITAHKESELLISRMKEQMESELSRANKVQHSFLPAKQLNFPKMASERSGSIEVVHDYRPSGPVGGDFFCLLPFSDSKIGIFIADVMGHGVGAALTMSALNAMAQSKAARLSKPEEFLERLNRRLCEVISRDDDSEFITAFYLVIDTSDGSVTFATAGHHSPLIREPATGAVRELYERGEVRGPALMLVPNPAFVTGEARLTNGERILLYTDGLTEMPPEPGSGEELGSGGLRRIIEGLDQIELSTFVENITARVLYQSGAQRFEDDVCLIGIEYRGTEENI
ncbi:SpoIIE family protein phosphatase [Haloferula chungangensis]|uniref:SpoIIE family protein phosphatase n=1 Tax=Haloferula chungangensis TaxID=1048331 RepID=A0ABW2L124_9BACT